MDNDRIYSHLENEVVNFLNFLIEFSTMRIPMEVHRARICPRDSRWWQRALLQCVLYRKSQLWSAEVGEFSSVIHQWCYRLVGSAILKGFWKSESDFFIPDDIGIPWHWYLNVGSKNFCKNKKTRQLWGWRWEESTFNLIYSISYYYTKYRQRE